jgi:hypothetical protein
MIFGKGRGRGIKPSSVPNCFLKSDQTSRPSLAVYMVARGAAVLLSDDLGALGD